MLATSSGHASKRPYCMPNLLEMRRMVGPISFAPRLSCMPNLVCIGHLQCRTDCSCLEPLVSMRCCPKGLIPPLRPIAIDSTAICLVADPLPRFHKLLELSNSQCSDLSSSHRTRRHSALKPGDVQTLLDTEIEKFGSMSIALRIGLASPAGTLERQ